MRSGAGQAALENTAELKKLKKLKKLKSRGAPRLLSSGLAIPGSFTSSSDRPLLGEPFLKEMIDFNKKRRSGPGPAALENTAELKNLKNLKNLKVAGPQDF